MKNNIIMCKMDPELMWINWKVIVKVYSVMYSRFSYIFKKRNTIPSIQTNVFQNDFLLGLRKILVFN